MNPSTPSPIGFSVVVNTIDRARPLDTLLRSLEHQSHPNFEVIAVVGPTRDDTLSMLEGWRDRVEVVRCPDANLGRSRNLGLLAARGDVEGAVREWEGVARLDPRDADVRLRLGLALGALGRPADAIASLRDAARLAPSSPEARYSLAVALHGRGDGEGARREIDEAIRLRPDWRRARGFREGLVTGTFPPPESLGD